MNTFINISSDTAKDVLSKQPLQDRDIYIVDEDTDYAQYLNRKLLAIVRVLGEHEDIRTWIIVRLDTMEQVLFTDIASFVVRPIRLLNIKYTP